MDPRDRVQNLLRRTMASLATPFEQLVFLASIRDAYSGRYLHEGWAQAASAEEVHHMAHLMHVAAFNGVLDLDLQTLTGDLRRHFCALSDPVQQVARLWLDTEPFREMLPAGCTVLERETFVSQVRIALGILVREPTSDVPPEPAASPLPPLARPPRRHPDA
jgi:hypothetical protein